MRQSTVLVSGIALQILATLLAGGCSSAGPGGDASGSATTTSTRLDGSQLERFTDGTGVYANYSTSGTLSTPGLFATSLGTNGRSCATCHRSEDGYTFTTATAQALFDATDGTDPLFRPVDGANSPNADVSTVDARRQAYSLLLSRGTIRIGLDVPATAEFTVDAVDDPYGYATATTFSLYRRPLMSSNLKFTVGTPIMWDGREPSLASQANNATMGHAETSQPLTADQAQSIVDFETSIFTAQVNDNGISVDDGTGNLIRFGGGPIALSQQPFSLNENAVPQSAPILVKTHNVFTLYSSLAKGNNDQQRSIARGEDIFNNRTLAVFGGKVNFTCANCHSAFNAGTNDLSLNGAGRFTNLGTSGGGFAAPGNAALFLASDLPKYTLRNKTTNAVFVVTDPGRALVTGRWNDIGLFKVPNLRGLSSHAPYFHNGLAPTLRDVVEFYNTTFTDPAAKTTLLTPGTPLSAQEKADLVKFLQNL